MSVFDSGKETIGLEVWTGDPHEPLQFFSIMDEDIEEIGDDGYAGGTHWVRYKGGETHAFMENAVRKVVTRPIKAKPW